MTTNVGDNSPIDRNNNDVADQADQTRRRKISWLLCSINIKKTATMQHKIFCKHGQYPSIVCKAIVRASSNPRRVYPTIAAISTKTCLVPLSDTAGQRTRLVVWRRLLPPGRWDDWPQLPVSAQYYNSECNADATSQGTQVQIWWKIWHWGGSEWSLPYTRCSCAFGLWGRWGWYIERTVCGRDCAHVPMRWWVALNDAFESQSIKWHTLISCLASPIPMHST